jgi:TrwC relaxase
MGPRAQAKPFVPMHHTMTVAAPARTAAPRRPAVAVKSDVRTGHDIAYVTRGHACGCAGAMAYYTRTGDPPGTWEGRGAAALGLSGTVRAPVAERLYQEGVAPGGEQIIRHAAPKTSEDRAAAESLAIARYQEKHPFASASEINAERTRIRATSPGISRPYYDLTSSASKSVSVLHASLRVSAGQARGAGDHVTAAALDGQAQAIEDALLDAVREGLEQLEAMACYVRTGHHSATTGEWRDGKGLVATSWLHTISRDGDPSCTSTSPSSTPSSGPTAPTANGGPPTGSTSTSSATYTGSPSTGPSNSGCWTWATP